MSRKRSGKRVRVRCFQKDESLRLLATSYHYPHSDREKKLCSNVLEIPLIDTGYHRPSQTIKVFLNEALDKNLWDYQKLDEVLSQRYWENIGKFLKGELFQRKV